MKPDKPQTLEQTINRILQDLTDIAKAAKQAWKTFEESLKIIREEHGYDPRYPAQRTKLQSDFETAEEILYRNASSTYISQGILNLITANPSESPVIDQMKNYLYSKPNYLG